MGAVADSPAPRASPLPTQALAVASAASLAVAIDIAWFDGANASLQTLLSFGASGASAALAAYALGGVASLIVAGTLASRHGWRWLMRIGAPLLFVAAMVSSAAAGSAMIVAGRLIAGVGAGMLTVSALVVIAAAYCEAERTKPYAIVAAAAAAAYVLVPTLAGFLVAQPFWRVTPLLSVPAVAAVVMLASRHRAEPPRESDRIDVLGLVLVIAATVTLYAAVSVLPSDGLGFRSLVGIALAMVLAAGFVRRERRLRTAGSIPPIIEPGLFANSTFAGAVAVAGMVRIGTGAAFLFIVQLSQYIVGLSSVVTQLALIPAALLGVGGDLLSPAVEKRLGTGGTIATGAFALAAAYVGLMVTTVETYAIAFVAVAIAAFGYELTVAPLNRAVVAATDDHGRAVSASATLAKLSSIIGLAVITAIFLAVYGDRLGDDLAPRELSMTIRLSQTPSPASIPATDNLLEGQSGLRQRFDASSSDAFLAAQRIAFLIPAIAAAVAGLIAMRIIRPGANEDAGGSATAHESERPSST